MEENLKSIKKRTLYRYKAMSESDWKDLLESEKKRILVLFRVYKKKQSQTFHCYCYFYTISPLGAGCLLVILFFKINFLKKNPV